MERGAAAWRQSEKRASSSLLQLLNLQVFSRAIFPRSPHVGFKNLTLFSQAQSIHVQAADIGGGKSSGSSSISHDRNILPSASTQPNSPASAQLLKGMAPNSPASAQLLKGMALPLSVVASMTLALQE